MSRPNVVAFFTLVIFTACSTPQLFEQIPLRDADLYPSSQSKAGVAVAVDQLTYPQRVKQYFGVDLIKAEVLPINIIVSNHGNGRYIIKPSDVLLMHGNDVIDPVPVKTVEKKVASEYGRMSQETASKVNDYFGSVMLQETVLAPHQNYQGFIFLKAEREKVWSSAEKPGFSLAQLFQEGSLKVRIAVTDLDTRERIHFGPFSLTGQ